MHGANKSCDPERRRRFAAAARSAGSERARYVLVTLARGPSRAPICMLHCNIQEPEMPLTPPQSARGDP